MMTFVNMASPGLLILPTHRVVTGLASFNEQAFLQSAKKHFSAEQLDAKLPDNALVEKLKDEGRDSIALVPATKSGSWLLRSLPSAQEALDGLGERNRQSSGTQLLRSLLQR